jgi:uncharacterized protein YdiU (UPF0061 family)
LLKIMHQAQADYTVTFRRLAEYLEADPATPGVEEALQGHPDFQAWLGRWRCRAGQEAGSMTVRADTMRRVNPKYIPRNHRIEEVIAAATEGDFAPFATLCRVTVHPFDEQPGCAAYAIPPRPEQRVLETFCGT